MYFVELFFAIGLSYRICTPNTEMFHPHRDIRYSTNQDRGGDSIYKHAHARAAIAMNGG